MQKEAPLLVPDVLVCSVGTEIFFESAGEADREWGRELDQGWDRQGALDAAAGIPELKQQVQFVPTSACIAPRRRRLHCLCINQARAAQASQQLVLPRLLQSCCGECLQAASEQRPHKLSYHLDAKGDAAEQVLMMPWAAPRAGHDFADNNAPGNIHVDDWMCA